MKKKAQSEIVGFVLIVVIVMIIGLFFFRFSLRQETEIPNDKEISNFLTSFRDLTTDCSLSYEPDYLDMAGLIKACDDNRNCLSGEQACDKMKAEIREIMENSWKKCYILDIYYEDGSYNKEIMKIQGNCSGNMAGNEQYIKQGSGQIVVSLDIYD